MICYRKKRKEHGKNCREKSERIKSNVENDFMRFSRRPTQYLKLIVKPPFKISLFLFSFLLFCYWYSLWFFLLHVSYVLWLLPHVLWNWYFCVLYVKCKMVVNEIIKKKNQKEKLPSIIFLLLFYCVGRCTYGRHKKALKCTIRSMWTCKRFMSVCVRL